MKKTNSKPVKYYLNMASLPDDSDRTIKEEKAFRRGLHHGFTFIMENLDKITSAAIAESIEKDLRKWRFSSEIKVESTFFKLQKNVK